MIKQTNINNTRKVVNLLLFVVFTLFATLQLNDPDPVKWFIIYGVVALISLLSYFWTISRKLILILVVVYSMYALSHWSYIVEYVELGNFDEIFTEMKEEKPYLEGTREFFGLLIAAVGLLYQLKNPIKN